jgi:hypothetical protein
MGTKNYDVVTIGKNDLPMYFGFNALRKYCRATGTSLTKLSTLGNDMSLDDIVELIYHGNEEGCRRAGVPFSSSADDIADMLDEDSQGMNRALELFADHMGTTFGSDDKKVKKAKKPLLKQK